jgi:NAD(P)-dependent dehydrogenase (short-subunit alcohol dehydrogenase family)
MTAAVERWGRIDILRNNVGVSIAGGDKPLDELTEPAFDRVSAINLRGTIMACKHVLPVMRRQRSGAIVNISSVAAYENTYPLVAYKATKAAMIAFTEQLALHNAPYGIRATCLMDTPMTVDTRRRWGQAQQDHHQPVMRVRHPEPCRESSEEDCQPERDPARQRHPHRVPEEAAAKGHLGVVLGERAAGGTDEEVIDGRRLTPPANLNRQIGD